jgi:large subunit ribosomal protein L18
MKREIKQQKRYRRHKRVRAKIFGTTQRPRLCVFRSAKHIYGQLIDDEKGKTLVSASDLELKKSAKRKAQSAKQQLKTKNLKKKEQLVKKGKVALAYEVGKLIAEKALEKKIKKVVFDRAGYKYHGRVKALAEGAREGGLEF